MNRNAIWQINEFPPSASAIRSAIFRTRTMCHQSWPLPSPIIFSSTYFAAFLYNLCLIHNFLLKKRDWKSHAKPYYINENINENIVIWIALKANTFEYIFSIHYLFSSCLACSHDISYPISCTNIFAISSIRSSGLSKRTLETVEWSSDTFSDNEVIW